MLTASLLVLCPLLAVLFFAAYALHLGATDVALAYRRLNLRIKVPAGAGRGGRRAVT